MQEQANFEQSMTTKYCIVNILQSNQEQKVITEQGPKSAINVLQ